MDIIRLSTIRTLLLVAICLFSTAPAITMASEPECASSLDEMFRAAQAGERDIVYIVAGDSTRQNWYSEMEEYYVSQFEKIGIDVEYSAQSGQHATNWLNNVSQSNAEIDFAIDASRGEAGCDTILEFSFGINDYKGQTLVQVKDALKNALTAYMEAKPQATVVLASPVKTSVEARNSALEKIYRELAEELSLPRIDVYAATEEIAPTVTENETLWYADGTHPNKYGSRRIVNFIIDTIVPQELLPLIDIPEYVSQTASAAPDIYSLTFSEVGVLQVNNSVESGYWSSTTGGPVISSNWRRLEEIAVDPGTELRITHGGNRRDVKFVNEAGTFVATINAAFAAGGTYLTITVPEGAAYARINVSSQGSQYDDQNDVPVVAFDLSNNSIQSGYWSSSNGVAAAHNNWRRLEEIAVDPGTELRITHGGNRRDVKFVNESGELLISANTSAVPGETYRTVVAPEDAAYARINVSSQGSAYDTVSDTPTVEFDLSKNTIQSGYWSSSNGVAAAHNNWRRLEEIAVDPGTELRITHGGNRRDVKFVSENGDFISSVNTDVVAGKPYRTVVAPEDAAYARINVSSQGSVYDAVNDIPTVEFDRRILTIAEMNQGLDLKALGGVGSDFGYIIFP